MARWDTPSMSPMALWYILIINVRYILDVIYGWVRYIPDVTYGAVRIYPTQFAQIQAQLSAGSPVCFHILKLEFKSVEEMLKTITWLNGSWMDSALAFYSFLRRHYVK